MLSVGAENMIKIEAHHCTKTEDKLKYLYTLLREAHTGKCARIRKAISDDL